MYFGLSSTAGAVLALVFIIWIIGRGLKSAGKNIAAADVHDTVTFKDIRKKLGMTWKDHSGHTM